MSYCLNPNCTKPQNPTEAKLCRTCKSKLLLRDRYRAIKPIGQGGFGRTFLAIDEDKPSKPRAIIKQFFPLDPHLIPSVNNHNSKKAAELFEQEAHRLDQLGKHPQIPELLAYTIQEKRQYVVQEFIDGFNLAQLVEKEGTFNENQIKELLNRLLPVLHFIHSQSVIHRDIKPENIICGSSLNKKQIPPLNTRGLGGDKLVLVDFGAAKFATGTALIKTGTTIGSPEYIAPEQTRGKAIFASDIYSLGVTCLYLLTQVSPFDLFDPGENKWIWREYLIGNAISEELGKILDKMIENAVNRRYQSASEVLTDLNPQAALKLQSIPVSIKKNTSKTKKITEIITPNVPHNHNWKCINTLTGHTQIIYMIALSPNGEVLASGSDDKTIKIWDVEDGKEIITLTGHTNSIYGVTFSPDGKLLASCSQDKTIKIWRMKDGKNIRTLTPHANSIYSLTFSPNGEFLASSSWDGSIKISRVKDGQEIRAIAAHQSLVYCVVFSPDGELLASSSLDKTIKIWRVKDGQLMRTLTSHLDWVRCVAFSPDGEFLASGSHDHSIKVWWVKNGQEILTFKGHSWYVDCLAFSPDGEYIISGSNQTIKLWRVKDAQEICTLNEHTNSVYAIAFSPDGETFASGSSDKTIKIWGSAAQ